jgi:hypothetical protein
MLAHHGFKLQRAIRVRVRKAGGASVASRSGPPGTQLYKTLPWIWQRTLFPIDRRIKAATHKATGGTCARATPAQGPTMHAASVEQHAGVAGDLPQQRPEEGRDLDSRGCRPQKVGSTGGHRPRLGLTAMPERAEIRSCAYRCRTTGVWPTGRHVVRTDRIRRNPASSTKTGWALNRAMCYFRGARPRASRQRWRVRPAPGPDARVSGGPTPTGAGVSPRGADAL